MATPGGATKKENHVTIQRWTMWASSSTTLRLLLRFFVELGIELEGEAPIEGRQDSYRLYVRGPEGIMVALAEQLS